jgi:radical SAM protein with 4Fe4S-binding SPASM domain
MLSTNIILLRDRGLAERMVRSGLDHALLCLEGAAPETYAFYRRSGDFEDALSGLRNLVEAKRASGGKTPFLELQFIVMKHNEHEIAKITALAEEIGVDRLSFKNCDVDLTCDELKAVMLDFLPGERENIIRKLLESPETPLQGCSQMMRSCVVLWNGDVVPCCYDWEGRHVFGNMNSEAFRKIWNGPAYVRFRKQVARNRRAIAMCAVCPEGLGSLFYE